MAKDAGERPMRHQRTDSSPFKAPSSIEAESISSRTLSDLSESYAYGRASRAKREPSVPRNIYPPSSSAQTAASSLDRPWRQAYVLSSLPPEIDCLLARLPKSRWSKHRDKRVVQAKDNCSRLPLVLLLMDPSGKLYELVQLWIDESADTVRAVLQSIRQQLPNTWTIDYDGLIERRGGRASLLINCVGIRQFKVVAHELWIAKPRKMSKDRTTRMSDVVLDHLKHMGIVQTNSNGIMTLSRAAQTRIHAPEGILTHHHAQQYLTFVPPFEPLPTPVVVDDVDNGGKNDGTSVVTDSGVSHTTLGIVKNYGTTCTDKEQEVVFGKKKLKEKKDDDKSCHWSDTNVDCGDTATTAATPENSISPLFHDKEVMRSDDGSQVQPSAPVAGIRPGAACSVPTIARTTTMTTSTATKGKGVGKLFSALSFRKTRKKGFLNLDFHESTGTCDLTDDDASSRNLVLRPIELDDDASRSVVSSSAPLLIRSSSSNQSLSVVPAGGKTIASRRA